ncbi:MAG: alpha/beta fold hydrolase [Deltaproteobacteria bacterium]|jgi:putative redox protein|nr:alpha/beta fold hydrolase [Deltaproteobacteria bacterium]MBW2530889.1 alpha/beta fold hydrolase [Deltaproteobacteria bacterium]
MPVQSVSFQNPAGEALSGLLELPEATPPFAFGLFAHCFTCSKDFKAPAWVSQSLAEQGVATLRFDFPGLGGSEGRFADTTLTKNVTDVVSAAEYLAVHHAAPAVLIGHSMGGAAVLRAASRVPNVRLVAALAAPAEPGAVGPGLLEARQSLERDGVARFAVAGRTMELRRDFFDDLAAAPLLDEVARLDATLLVFHSPTDTIVPLDNAERLYAAAPYPKGILALDGASHLFDRREDCRFIADTIAAWCRREG